MAEYVLEARDIVKTFPGVRALDGVDLGCAGVRPTRWSGENGAGKSTLMLALTGVHRPDEGTILLDGKPGDLPLPQDAVRQGDLHRLPGAQPGPLPLHRGEHLRQPPAGGRASGSSDRGELTDRTREYLALFDLEDARPRHARAHPLPGQPAGGGDPQGHLHRPAGAHPGRAHLLPHRGGDRTGSSRTSAGSPPRGIACLYISHHLPEIFEIAETRDRSSRRPIRLRRPGGGHRRGLPRRQHGRPHDLRHLRGASAPPSSDRCASRRAGSAGRAFSRRRPSRCGPARSSGFSGLVGAGRTELGPRHLRRRAARRRRDVPRRRADRARARPATPSGLGIGYLTEDRKTQGLFLDFPVRANLAANRLERLCRGPLVSDALVDGAAEHGGPRVPHRLRRRAASPCGPCPAATSRRCSSAPGSASSRACSSSTSPRAASTSGRAARSTAFFARLAGRGTAIIMISSDLTRDPRLSDRIYVMKSGRIAGELAGADGDRGIGHRPRDRRRRQRGASQ